MTRGVILGKFAPLTQGHVSCIIRAASRVDQLCVVLCWDEKFQQTLTDDLRGRLSLKNRHRWLLETLEKYPSIRVCVVDESDIQAYPQGAKAFTKLVRKELRDLYGEDKVTHVFSSEPEYDAYFDEHFPEAIHEVIDANRTLTPISATQVRADVYGHWGLLAPAARADFVQRIVVIGCESTGKSTLVKELVDYFDTVSIPEVGRVICEDEFFSHEEYMDQRDYELVAYRHTTAEVEAHKKANKVLISDTNNLITEFSAQLMGHISPLLAEMSRNEQYDLVLYLDIDVPWVGDNLRRNGDDDRRRASDALLRRLCKERNVQNIVHINGSYEERFLRSVQAIKGLLGGQS